MYNSYSRIIIKYNKYEERKEQRQQIGVVFIAVGTETATIRELIESLWCHQQESNKVKSK